MAIRAHTCEACGNEFRYKYRSYRIRKYCSLKCSSPSNVKNRKPLPPLADYFWTRVDQKGPDECWPWLRGVMSKGYGQIYHQGKDILSHRIAWSLANGPIPEGLDICHHCDNPICCNPKHLFAGTHADNMADKARKGRASRIPRNRHPQAKLTEEQVADIIASSLSQPKTAKLYGVAESLIWHLRRQARLNREKENGQ